MDTGTAAANALTLVEAAKLVSREAIEIGKDNKPTGNMKQVSVKPDDVLAFKDYDDHVIVVTKDGQKLRGEKK